MRNSTRTLIELKADYERLRIQMTPDVQAFNTILLKLFEALILSKQHLVTRVYRYLKTPIELKNLGEKGLKNLAGRMDGVK
jgi:hypothetical protein